MSDAESQLQSAEQQLAQAVADVTALVQQLRVSTTQGGSPTAADVEAVHNSVIALNQLVPAATDTTPTTSTLPSTPPAPAPTGGTTETTAAVSDTQPPSA